MPKSESGTCASCGRGDCSDLQIYQGVDGAIYGPDLICYACRTFMSALGDDCEKTFKFASYVERTRGELGEALYSKRLATDLGV